MLAHVQICAVDVDDFDGYQLVPVGGSRAGCIVDSPE